MKRGHNRNQSPSSHDFQQVLSTFYHLQTEVKGCSQNTLKLPGVTANYCHLGISSSNTLPGCFRTSKKANYNVVLLVSGVYCLLLHRQLLFPLPGFSKPNPTEQQMEGNLN